MDKYLTIDVGGTNIKYALMNENAEIEEKGEYTTPMENGLDGFIASVVEVYQKYDGIVKAVAVSAPGKIDAQIGYFYTSGALQYISGINLADKLKEFISVPCVFENDAKCAALAEMWKGSMSGVANGMVMTLGTGIGGAVIIEGRLYRGSTFAAGEFSGISTRLDHPTYVADEMWARQNGVGFLVKDYAERIGADEKTLNGRILFEKANEGDEDAVASIRHFCKGLSAGIMALQFALDVEKVAIGGGISKQPLLMKILREEIVTYYGGAITYMPASIPEIVSCTFGNDANMIGALYHYLNDFKK